MFLRLFCFEKIEGTGRTDRQTDRRTNGQAATLNVPHGWPHNNNTTSISKAHDISRSDESEAMAATERVEMVGITIIMKIMSF